MRPCYLLPLALTLAACGGGATDSVTPPPPPPPPPPPATFTLTLTLRSIDPAARAGVLYAYIGDVTETRQRMPAVVNENAPILVPITGQASRTITIQVPRDKFVTLFATELGRSGMTGARPNAPLVPVVPDDATEFISFEGSPVTEIETGVAYLKMDGDKTVTVNYDRMVGFTTSTTGCTNLKVSWKNQQFLGFGERVTDDRPTAFGGLTLLGGTLIPFNFAWGKQGATVTLEAFEREARTSTMAKTGFMFWEGARAGCGTILTCDVPIPARGAAPVTVEMRNSWVLNATAVNGIACGACTATAPEDCGQFIGDMRP
ncbi:MAG: hypothetical protein AB7L66_18260 [Gemmatimonadales bacterium]